MHDLNEYFDSQINIVKDFPELDIRFVVMQDFIKEITEFLEFTYSQKIQRLKHKISTIEDEISQDEMIYELNKLQENGLDHLSHNICGGILISIFSSYESSIQEIFEFFSDKFNFPIFQKKGRTSFIDAANQYSIENFQCSLFDNPFEQKVLKELSQLRNSFVHNGCSLNRLPTIFRKLIEEGKYKDCSLGVKDGRWFANSKNTQLYFHHVYKSFISYQRRVTDVLLKNSDKANVASSK